jgi:ABC-type glycerol-3-phosphate transport system permease component
MRPGKSWHWGRGLFLTVCLISVILPLLWTVLASLKVQPNNTVSPPTWSLPPSFASYLEIRSEQTFFWQELATSVLLSLLTTLLTIFIAFLAAYVLARTRLQGRKLVVQGCLILASLPAISFAFPLSDVLRFLHLHDTFVGLLLAETAFSRRSLFSSCMAISGSCPENLKKLPIWMAQH